MCRGWSHLCGIHDRSDLFLGERDILKLTDRAVLTDDLQNFVHIISSHSSFSMVSMETILTGWIDFVK
jgi:hypothetical protein